MSDSLDSLPNFPKHLDTSAIDDVFSSMIVMTADQAAGNIPCTEELSRLTLCFLTVKNGHVFVGQHLRHELSPVNESISQGAAVKDAVCQALQMENYAKASL